MRKIIFFITISTLILGIIGWWYYQKNTYSKEILKLEIIGPEKVNLGDEVEYIVKYRNNGDVRLEEPKLIFEYPTHSILEKGAHIREEINSKKLGGPIYPGQERTIKFRARLLGKENEVKVAKAWLSFRPRNLSARYESVTTCNTLIEHVPITFQFDLPSKIESGREFDFRLNYFSNTDFPLSDLGIKIEYPDGFEFKSATPKSLGDKEWEIPILNKAEGGRIEITGDLQGEVGENKIFKAMLGIWQGGEFVILKEIYKGVEIVEPNLYIIQQINGNPEYVASPGDLLHYEIFLRNLGKEPLENLFVVIRLKGEAYDLDTVNTLTGNFQAGDNSVLFDWRKNHQLEFLNPQEEAKIEFWVELKKEWDVSNIEEEKNPTIKDEISVLGTRKEFETKVNSRLEIVQKGYFQDEVFGNSGPMPPRVGEKTTFTIIWQVRNYFNKVKDIKVKATLPQNVELTGKIFPEDQSQKFAFDSQSHEIIWNIGELEPGTGVINDPLNIAFQVSLRPTSDQKGSPALLIKEARIIGEDEWTSQIIDSTSPEIDTTLPDDPTISEETGKVQ
ncbi:hypothetical protein J7K24_00730 [bacterium]|nr:hypothetical protein [bacterium]